MLDDLMSASESVRQAPSIPAKLGPPTVANQNTSKGTQSLQPEEAQRYAERCMHLLMKSNDELLHVTIYDWMLRKKLADRLLHVSVKWYSTFYRWG